MPEPAPAPPAERRSFLASAQATSAKEAFRAEYNARRADLGLQPFLADY